jgi:hypothetical protein
MTGADEPRQTASGFVHEYTALDMRRVIEPLDRLGVVEDLPRLSRLSKQRTG